MPSSTRKVKRIIRPLTVGEINLAKDVFKSQIDYEQVKIHQGTYLRFGLQKAQIAMAPNGHIYFPNASYLPDFSNGTISQQAWFIHEITHVWQYQQGISVILRGLWLALLGGYLGKRRAYVYYLPKNLDRKLADFNIEQQACIMADFFLLHHSRITINQEQALFVTHVVAESGLG